MNALGWVLLGILIVVIVAAVALWARGRRRGGVIATSPTVRRSTSTKRTSTNSTSTNKVDR
jgi:hypothetical protein